VILPTKASIGISSFKSSKLKYFYWICLLASQWFPMLLNLWSLESIGIPLGHANGVGLPYSISFKGELDKRLSLYEGDTVAH